MAVARERCVIADPVVPLPNLIAVRGPGSTARPCPARRRWQADDARSGLPADGGAFGRAPLSRLRTPHLHRGGPYAGPG